MRSDFKILLVDDDPIDQLFIKKALLKVIPNVDLVCSLRSEKAIQLLEEREYLPDLIITDLNMPGESGIEFLKRIRDNVKLHNIPVIMMSTSAAQSDVNAAYLSRVSTYIQKPFDIKSYDHIAKVIVDYWCNIALLPS
ncbi:response regulator [Hirschia baltica]|uniref:Response regulator receiver protein n=1 Tax=Hirschia baltica (strain ATCC 49814 / DSM 5838 / IFAM 1418) TaxID=582402 RepID=C6XJ09_HIRBI|nr:response regulator [Hirschia baltica]ACT59104.1 response regulator receiver protein [Hirschia baltica ATCC 49814]